jgi:hypothetical protein
MIIYPTLLMGAFGSGLIKGIYSEHVPPMSAGIDAFLTYTPILGGAGISFVKESGMFEGPPSIAGVAFLGFGAATAGATAIGCTLTELVGYGIGCIASKIAN